MLEIRLAAVIALVAACGRQQGEAPAKEHTRLEGEIALSFGDCAPPSTRFISGPEPQPFDEVRTATTLYATMSPGGDVAAGFEPSNVAPSSSATLNIDTISVDMGKLDSTLMRSVLARVQPALTACYEHEPNARGPVPVTIVISRDGSVGSVKPAELAEAVASCVSKVLIGLQFPKPSTPVAKATVTLSFASPTPASVTDKVTATDVVASARYLPGTASPLGALRLALLDCFREQDQRMGVAVFDLAPTSITAHGIDNAAFTKCVADLAPQVRVKAPMRCSAAFGSALLPELPHIDLQQDGVVLDGKRIEIQETDEWWKLEPIFTWSTNRVRATLTSKEPIVLHGPVIVRPAPTTEMKIVTKLLHTLIAAGDDPMLAADRDGVWLPLHPRNLPVIPVPLGTGGSWNSDKAKLAVPRISILVGKQQVWIDGVAVTDEKAELAAAEQHGAVEIAAQGQVPYSRVVEVIDELGGIDWSLTAGRALAKLPNREQPHIERTTRHDVRGAPISK